MSDVNFDPISRYVVIAILFSAWLGVIITQDQPIMSFLANPKRRRNLRGSLLLHTTWDGKKIKQR